MIPMTNRQAADAVHSLFSALEKSLRKDRPLPRDVALFCAQRLRSFLVSDVWSGGDDELGVDEEFAALDRSRETELDKVLGREARLPEAPLRRITSAFCIAHGLSNHPSHDAMDYPRIIEASGRSKQRFVRIPRESRFSFPAERVVIAAEGGDPRALREILGALVSALERSLAMPRRYAFFCADALRSLLVASPAWEAIGQREVTTNHRRKFGGAVCRAFRLSKGQATRKEGEYPKHRLTCPPPVFKFEELLHYGVSWRSANSIILTAFREPAERSLGDWLKFMKIRVAHLDKHSLISNRLEIAKQVRRATASRRSRDQTYLLVARNLAAKLFPCFESQANRWAARVLRDAKRRPQVPVRVELAHQIREAIEQDVPLHTLPQMQRAQVLTRIKSVRGATRLPEGAVRKLVPSVREAYRFALSVGAV